jgi:hypothetical protein
MRRRTYLGAVGASVALPVGVGRSILSDLNEPDHLTPDEFRQQIPEQIGNYEGGITYEGETDTAGRILIAIYQDSKWPVGIQYIEDGEIQLISMMDCTHYYPDSLTEAVSRLGKFLSKVDVTYSELRDDDLEYITYEFTDGYRVRTEYDHRDGGRDNYRAWVNGHQHDFSDRHDRNEFVNEEVQGRL